MDIIVNGKKLPVEDGLTVGGLLDIQKIVPARVAVEINRSIVSRADFDFVKLAPDDTVEIIRFVGGG
jgi:thiamine biosynthesis protein ThiS